MIRITEDEYQRLKEAEQLVIDRILADTVTDQADRLEALALVRIDLASHWHRHSSYYKSRVA